MNDIRMKTEEAYGASLSMGGLTSEVKKDALRSIADALLQRKEEILEANRKDISIAQEMVEREQISKAVFQRLTLDDVKISNIVDMVNSVAMLPDPVGETTYSMELDDGLELFRVTSPVGVIGFIFESRPDALVQIASLCLKSGNSCLLKGGAEAGYSNKALFGVIRDAASIVPDGWIQLIEARQEVKSLLEMHDLVDLVIPRGSNEFVKYIQDNTKIPVLGHSEGVCHIYVDSEVDLKMALEVCLDSKVQYPAVCNAVDCILIHRDTAETFLPLLVERMRKGGVQLRGGKEIREMVSEGLEPFNEADLGKEYLDYILALRIVNNLEEAVDYINKHGSHHTDAILTGNPANARRFMKLIGSASVFWNASTRFSDGYRYGLGAEVGISTGKIHARGPTGLEGLLSYKYYLKGNGQIVGDYVGKNKREFKHLKTNKKW